MLRWINRNIWKDKIRNKEICLKIRVDPIDDRMRKSFLR